MPYIGNNHIAGDHTNNFKVLDDISSFTATFDGSATSVVDTTNNTIRVVEHRFIQGQRVTYTNGGGGDIGGLSTDSAYFVIFDSASTIKLATNASNAASSTAINLSAVGTGSSHTLNAAFDGVNTKFKLTHGSGTGARLNNATQINVAINNVVQRPNLDPNNFTDGFALEDNHKIVFQTAPTSEDIFWGSVIANTLTTFDISDHKIDTFTGDGSTTEFTLSHTPANNESLMVTINGVLQHPSNASTARAYTLIASIIQFTAAPGVGDEIQVRHMGFAGATTADVSGFYGRTGNVVLTSNDHITTGDITARNFRATGITTFGGANFSGNVSIGGTLTYEDVTNIDSVGLGTFRDGIFIPDSKKIKIGNTASTPDIEIYHSPSNAFIDNHTGGLFIRGNVTSDVGGNVVIQAKVNENSIICHDDGAVELYHNAVKKFETTSAGVTVTGSATASTFAATNNVSAGGNISITSDTGRLYLGASQDLQIFHNGSHSYIQDNGTGALLIGSGNTSGAGVYIRGKHGEESIIANSNGSVELYYDNAKKLETTTNGIDITGSSTFAQLKLKLSNGSNTGGLYGNSTSLYLLDGQDHQFMQCVKDGEVIIKHDNSNILRTYPTGVEIIGALYATSVDLNDNQKILLGTGDDLELYHNGTNSIIKNNSGELEIRGNVVKILGATGAEASVFTRTGSVELTHNGVKKFETTSAGATLTGSLTITNDLDLQDDLRMGDTDEIQMGDSKDFRLYHTSGTNYIEAWNDSDFKIAKWTGSAFENMAQFISDGAVELYHDAVKKFETSSTGIDVTGKIKATQNIEINADNMEFRVGAGDDLKISHTGSENLFKSDSPTNFKNAANNETIATFTPNGNVVLYHNNTARLITDTTGITVNSRITASGDANTYINVGSSADTLDFFTGGSNFFRFDSSGRMLLNTVTEGHAAADNLTIADSGNSGITIRSGTTNNGTIYFSDGTSGTAEYKGAVRYTHSDNALGFYANGSEKLRITSDGKLGLGTNNPSEEFVVYGADPKLEVQEASVSSKVTLGTGTVTGFAHIQKADGTRTVQLNGNGNSFLIGGNFGVGTNSPTRSFHVKGMASGNSTNRMAIIESTGTAGSFIAFQDANTTDDSKCRIGSIGGNSIGIRGDEHKFQNGGGTDRMVITSGGLVGINDPSPATRLSVIHDGGGGSAYDVLTLGGNAAGNNTFPKIRFRTTDNSNTLGRIGIFDAGATNSYAGDFVVELNPGTSGNTTGERFRVKHDGSVNIGNPGGYAIWNALSQDVKVQFELRHTVGVPAGMALLEERGDSNGTNLILGKSRGGNGVGVINSGDTLGSIKFSGADGTRQHNGAAIVSWTSGTIATGRVPANLSFYTAPDSVSGYLERFRILSDGGVKIPTFPGTGNLISGGGSSVYANAAINFWRQGNGYCDMRLSSNYGVKIALAGASNNTDEAVIQQDNSKNMYIKNEASQPMYFQTGSSNTTRVAIRHSGSAGVDVYGESAYNNASSGARGIDVSYSGSASVPIYFGTEHNTAQKGMYMYGYWMYIRGHQNEGIRFIFSQGHPNAPRSDQYQFKYNSAYRPGSSQTWDGFSDARAKENVQTLTNGIETIKKLRPVTYDWTDDFADSQTMYIMGRDENGGTVAKKENGYDIDRKNGQYGFIAQEYETVLPKDVKQDKFTLGDTEISDFKTINHDCLIPTLTAALKEAIAKIETLEAKVAALEGS